MASNAARVHASGPEQDVEAKRDEMGAPYSYDPNFHGIDGNRKCTDVCMLIFFILFICGEVAVLIYALMKSNPNYLYIPTDHRDLFCGFNNSQLVIDGVQATDLPDLTALPYLFWVRPGKKGYARSFCVASCPTEGSILDVFTINAANDSYFPYGLNYNASCGVNSTAKATIYNYSVTNTSYGPGYFCPYATSLFARRCFPDVSGIESIAQELAANISASFSTTGFVVSVVSDFELTWKVGAIAIACALVLSIIWLLALRCVAGFFVWLTVLLSCAALGALTWLLYMQKEDKFSTASVSAAYTFGLWSKSTNNTVFTVLFWVMVGIDSIFFLVLLFLCDRIKLSISMIKVVSRVFGNVFSLFFFPVFVYILLLLWWAFSIYLGIVLFGAGYPSRVYDSDRGVERIEYLYTYAIRYLSIYHAVAFIWIGIFITDLAEMTVAGVFSNYYFNREPRVKNMGCCPVFRSLSRALRYHVGSLATGSLIITICKIIRYTLEYIDKKTKGTQSTAMKFLLKCLMCCFWCLEKFLKFLNRNVYIMISIHGEGFWTSCKKSFQLLLRNCVRVLTINWVGDFTLFLGRVFVGTGVTAAFVYYVSRQISGVAFVVFPAIVVALFSYIASGAFTGIFELGIDSMFLCFMEDEERHDGSPGHETYAPPELAKHLST